MALDWTALHELAAAAVERSNHSASPMRDSYLNDDRNVVYASSHVCVPTNLFVFESLMNSTSRPRILSFPSSNLPQSGSFDREFSDKVLQVSCVRTGTSLCYAYQAISFRFCTSKGSPCPEHVGGWTKVVNLEESPPLSPVRSPEPSIVLSIDRCVYYHFECYTVADNDYYRMQTYPIRPLSRRRCGFVLKIEVQLVDMSYENNVRKLRMPTLYLLLCKPTLSLLCKPFHRIL